MKCPFCSSDNNQVKDSREASDGSNIKRRRACLDCGSRFVTLERIQLKDLLVKKSDGTIVPFDREKLARSIRLACRKRGISDDRIDKIVTGIQRHLETIGDAEVTSRYIGELAMEALGNVDIVAHIRYASVYKNFDNFQDFMKFIEVNEREKTPASHSVEEAPKVFKNGKLF